MMDIDNIRAQFPILREEANNKPLVYLDSAATSQKPQSVIDAITYYYEHQNSNVHRGAHFLADIATRAFEASRTAVKSFINAASLEEIIFTKGTTEGINLVASSYGRSFLKAGDEIIISTMEHHSNIVPWQILAEEKKLTIKVIPLNVHDELDLDALKNLLSEKTKLVAIMHVSNAMGTINDVGAITKIAHEVGAVVLVDGAQSSPHFPVDVQALDCDFYVFSSHKIYGPTGMGVLYGKKKWLEAMPPYLGGGEMIKEVTFEKTTFNDLPYKFEAGTPNIGDAIAMKNAIDFIEDIGKEEIAAHEYELTKYATERMKALPKVEIVGNAPKKVGVISFLVDGIHHFDLGLMLDARGIAIRTGHHCAQPLMRSKGIDGTARISFGVYNTKAEIDTTVDAIENIIRKFAK